MPPTDLFSPTPLPAVPLAERLRPRTHRRGDRPASPARPRQAARRRVRLRQAALDDPVGTAGGRQDHARAVDGGRVQRGVHCDLGGACRRQGHPRGGRARRARRARSRAGRRSCSSTRCTASTRRSRTRSCLTSSRGTVTFIGATTENPSFEVNSALLSRAAVYVLEPLSAEDLGELLDRAIAGGARRGTRRCRRARDAARRLRRRRRAPPHQSRRAARRSRRTEAQARTRSTSAFVEQTIARSLRRFDKGGEAFYDQISALHKAVRGSDPDACALLDVPHARRRRRSALRRRAA